MIERILTTLAEITISTTILIAFLLILYPLLDKRYSVKLRKWIWLVLAVRLLVLFNPTFNFSPIELTTPAYSVNVKSNSNIKEMKAGEDQLTKDEITDIGNTPFHFPEISISNYNYINDTNIIPINTILFFIWLNGILAFICYYIINYLTFLKFIRRWNSPIYDEKTLMLFERLKQELSIKKLIALRYCKKLKSPLMTGLFHPVILLPEHEYNENLEFILRHELTHYKCNDILYKIFLLFTNAVHWFNPFVYIMVRLSNKDLELCCDQSVVSGNSLNYRKDYSMILLNAVSDQNFKGSALTTYFIEGKMAIKQRFRSILNLKNKKKGISALCLIIVLSLMTGIIVACNQIPAEKLYDDSNDKNTLLIYEYSNISFAVEKAVKRFKKAYPEITVTVKNIDGIFIDYLNALTADILVSEGPDVIILDKWSTNNISKLVNKDVFEDINILDNTYKKFKYEDYNTLVMDTGIIKGERLFVPLTYTLPVLFTTKELMEKYNIKYEGVNFETFANSILSFNNGEASNGNNKVFFFNPTSFGFLYNVLGTVDFNDPTTSIDNEETAKIFNLYNKIQKGFYKAQDKFGIVGHTNYTSPKVGALFVEDCLFMNSTDFYSGEFTDLITLNYMYELTSKKGYTPIVFPIPTLDGSEGVTVAPANIAAINKNSQSKKAAYLFIEMIINQSDVFDRFEDHLETFEGVPINNKYLENSKTAYKELYTSEKLETIFPLSDSFIDSYLNIIDNIKECRLVDDYIYINIIPSILMKYEKENMSYEDSVKVAQNALELYRAE